MWSFHWADYDIAFFFFYFVYFVLLSFSEFSFLCCIMIFKLVLMKFMLAISRYLLGLIVKKYLICFGKIVPGQTLKLCNILEYPLVPSAMCSQKLFLWHWIIHWYQKITFHNVSSFKKLLTCRKCISVH